MKVVYLDASALVKLAIAEAESRALADALAGATDLATSIVGRIELERVVRRELPDLADERLSVIDRWLTVIPLHVAIAGVARTLRPSTLRTLDAMHLASALAVDELSEFYCYDARLADAARERGIAVRAPA